MTTEAIDHWGAVQTSSQYRSQMAGGGLDELPLKPYTHAEDIPPRGAAAAVAVRGRHEGELIKPPGQRGAQARKIQCECGGDQIVGACLSSVRFLTPHNAPSYYNQS